jgi:putative flippase GtrA
MAAMTVIELSWDGGLVNQGQPDVDIVVPVYNEQAQLESSIRTLAAFVNREFPLATRITIADNASTDGTWATALALAASVPGVRAIHLDQKGRGRALRAAWSASDAAVVAYLDVDLSTGLDALLPLVAPLLSGHSDIAIGTRLAPGSRVVRGPVRELISRGYIALVHLVLRGRFSDAQCGFKALRRDVAEQLLPIVEDEAWFFDTELLVVAERMGLRIHEVPVDWVDDPDSRVDIPRTIVDDCRGVLRLARHRTRRPGRPRPGPATSAELLRFAGVGVFSTLISLAVFAALWPLLGGFAANALAVVGCGVGNLAVHRRLAGAADAGRRRLIAVATGLIGASVLLTTAAVAIAGVLFASSLPAALIAVTLANAVGALGRFSLLRAFVFRPNSWSTTEPVVASPPVDRPITDRLSQGA